MSAVKEAMQRIEERAEWMKEHAEEMFELLKDARDYFDGDPFKGTRTLSREDQALANRIQSFIAKVERIR